MLLKLSLLQVSEYSTLVIYFQYEMIMRDSERLYLNRDLILEYSRTSGRLLKLEILRYQMIFCIPNSVRMEMVEEEYFEWFSGHYEWPICACHSFSWFGILFAVQTPSSRTVLSTIIWRWRLIHISINIKIEQKSQNKWNYRKKRPWSIYHYSPPSQQKTHKKRSQDGGKGNLKVYTSHLSFPLDHL